MVRPGGASLDSQRCTVMLAPARPLSTAMNLPAARVRACRRTSGYGLAAVAVVLGLGLGLRLVRLGEVPAGFHPDEAHNALDAWRILHGWRPAYLPGNNGREPLFMYAMALVFAGSAPTVATARLTAALAGAAAIAAQALFVANLPLPSARRIAVLSAAVVSLSFWPVAQSRYAIEAVALPMWMALALAGWWRLVRAVVAGERPARLVGLCLLTAALVAGANYTHLIGRILLPVILVHGIWLGHQMRRRAVAGWMGLTLALAMVLLLPMLQVFVREPSWFVHRSSIVSVFGREERPLTAIAQNGLHLLEAANLRGDVSWSHNLRSRPIFDPPLGVLYLVGLGLWGRDLLGRRGLWPQAGAVLLGLALFLSVLPSLLSIGAPNYTRLVGTWPVLFLLPAWGLHELTARLSRGRDSLWLALSSALLGLSLLWTVTDYFGRYATQPQVATAFLAPVRSRGQIVAEFAVHGPTYAMPALWQQSVVRFLCLGHAVRSFDPAGGFVIPQQAQADHARELATAVRYLCDPAEFDRCTAVARAKRLPSVRWSVLGDERGLPVLGVLELPAGSALPAWVQPLPSGNPVFGQAIELCGLQVTMADELADQAAMRSSSRGRLRIAACWRARGATKRDHNFFFHVLDSTGRSVAQADGSPLGGSYPTDTWLPGDIVLQWLELTVDEAVAPGPLQVRTGFYDWRTLDRLPLPESYDNAFELNSGVAMDGL